MSEDIFEELFEEFKEEKKEEKAVEKAEAAFTETTEAPTAPPPTTVSPEAPPAPTAPPAPPVEEAEEREVSPFEEVEEEIAQPVEETVEAAAEEIPAEEELPSWLEEEEEEKEEVEEKVEEKEERISVEVGITPKIPEEFDFTPVTGKMGETFMIYGEKGDGKTTLAFSFPGKIACISFDRKSYPIKRLMYEDDPRITVYDGLRYLDKSSPEKWLESAVVSYQYINALLKKIAENPPDWIVIDGLEIFVRDICEMTMRCRNRIPPFGGVELSLWKERNMYVDQIHDACLAIARRGVIYTAYVMAKTTKIESGRIVEAVRQPKWAANVKYQVDTVIHVWSEESEEGRRFYAEIESSKTPGLKTGVKADVTGGGMRELIKASKGG